MAMSITFIFYERIIEKSRNFSSLCVFFGAVGSGCKRYKLHFNANAAKDLILILAIYLKLCQIVKEQSLFCKMSNGVLT